MRIRELLRQPDATWEAADPQLAVVDQQVKQLKLKKAQIKANNAQKKLNKARAPPSQLQR